MSSIRACTPLRLDLADLTSLKTSVDALELNSLDAIVYNAGVLLDQSQRRETKDGNELTFGTNHLGHFALTHWLAPLLSAAHGSRVVTTGSFTGKSARLDLDDLQTTRDYQPKRAYERSKLAQMLFGFELDRRLRAAGSTTLSVVTHPGGRSARLPHPTTPAGTPPDRRRKAARPARRHFLFLQGKEAAAWSAVRAVLDPSVRGGQMWGPRVLGTRGKPTLERVQGRLADTTVGARLWAASSDLTGVEPSFSPG
jgi:NAD(P)-dependent dehydrogenase (short-subunit alcohol dehydrogenase family)